MVTLSINSKEYDSILGIFLFISGLCPPFQGFWHALAAWDKPTAYHCIRVAQISKSLAAVLGFDAAGTRAAWWAGLLHDLGKAGIPREILRKPGKLTSEEREIINTHPLIAARILTPLADADLPRDAGGMEIIRAVITHHERWDGRGYPYGLAGEEIPRLAQILAVADAYSAMKEPRPYRQPFSNHEMWRELEKGAGTQFNPEVVEAFVSLYKKKARAS